jgi:hypothetical protein
MFTIGEFARLGGVSVRTLRHYDDIGLVVIAGQAPAFGAENIVPVVNRLDGLFEQLEIHDRVKEAGPRMIFYEYEKGEDVTVYLALPVAERLASFPRRPSSVTSRRLRRLPRPAAGRLRASFRWSTTTWSDGSRSTATRQPLVPAVRCG